MRAATLGGFLVLPWSGGGAEPELRTYGVLGGALLGVTVFCENHAFTPSWNFVCSLVLDLSRFCSVPPLLRAPSHTLELPPGISWKHLSRFLVTWSPVLPPPCFTLSVC